ncbi:hypothetical protein GCM10010151_20950 [Actinoallomurus spadix]|uniref:Uncharacterized protein n=1 Tax=Actinoallomurus spadix TaxID=79912 RepID=A0ABP3G1C4_9ACTN
MQYAITEAITSPISSPVPAARAAGPNAANTPAPIIDPSPITTASPVPNLRARWSPPPEPGPADPDTSRG